MAFKLGIYEVFQDIKDILAVEYLLLKDSSQAPPNNRNIHLGFVPLQRRTENGIEDVGCFVPELYELAKVGQLRCQLEGNAELLRADGTPKTPFELAVLPYIFSQNNKKSALPIEKHVVKEYQYRKEHGLPLPAPIYKYTIKPEYLRYIERETDLIAQGCQGITLNLMNPEAETTKRDRRLHYIAQRSAYFLTLLAAFSATSMATPLVIASALMSTFLISLCANQFGMFGLMETMHRTIDWVTNKNSWTGSDITLARLAKTAVLLGVLVLPAYGAAVGAFEGVMALALPTLTAGSTLASVLGFAQLGLASFAAAIAGVGMFAGAADAQHFFWGLSIFDKQIRGTEVTKEVVDALPKLTQKDKYKDKSVSELESKPVVVEKKHKTYIPYLSELMVRIGMQEQSPKPQEENKEQMKLKTS